MPIPNQQMKTEAQHGLDWRREFGRGGTEVGIVRERGILRTEDNKTMQDTKSLAEVQAFLQLAQAELADMMQEKESEEPEPEQEGDAMPMPDMPDMAIMAKVYTSPTAELKLVGEDDSYAYVEGYGVVFGGVDLTGDTFTAETDYKLARATGADVFVDHTLDTEIKIGGNRIVLKGIDDEVGEIETITADQHGLYMRLKLMKASQYWAMVSGMLGTKRCGLSTGSVGHLVRREGGVIKAWPIAEVSLTLTPAEPRTANVQLKSDLTAEPEAQPEAIPSGLVMLRDEADSVETIKTKENIMSDESTKALNEQITALGERFDQVLKALQDNPRAKDTGMIAPDDEGGRKNVKSFGDFLLAVKNQNRGRLAKVYHAIKDMDADVGTAGGFLVPEEYGSRLLQFNPMTSPLRSAVQVINAQTATGRYPVLDQFITPTAGSGQTAFAAGMVATTAGPGTTLAETGPTFEQLQWNLKKRGAYVQVDNELVDDSPIVIEQLLTSLARVTITARAERDIIRGSGAGEPLGFLTSSAAVGITPDTNSVFAYADALEMVSRFKSVGGQGMWLIHPSMWTDIGVFEVSAGSGGVFQANLGGSLGQNLLGFPIVQSEHMPQANSSGCVALIDPTAYLWFTKGDLTVSYSDQAFFTTDQVGWRFTERADGMPWLRNPITLADPQGSFTQSPFVYFND